MPCNLLICVLSMYSQLTFHINLTEAKIANELMTSVQSLGIQLSRVLFPGLHIWPNLVRVLQSVYMIQLIESSCTFLLSMYSICTCIIYKLIFLIFITF